MTIRAFKQAALGTVLMAVFLVSGCATAGSLPMFDDPQETGDKLPAEIKADKIDQNSSRFLGTDSQGVKYFVAKAEAKGYSEICLVVVPAESGWALGCGESLPVSVGVESGKQATLHPKPTPDTAKSVDEWVGEYLSVKQ